MAKKALVVTALAGFITSFLQTDIKTLQDMGYEVHCAGNASNHAPQKNEQAFRRMGAVFHQVDFSSRSPLSKTSWTAMKQIRKLLREEQFDLIHCHTPIAGAIVRVAAAPYRRRKKTRVIYTSNGVYFHKKSDKKSWIVYYTIEKLMSALCDAIITINTEDYAVAQKMFCPKVYHINGAGCNTARYRNVRIDRNAYRAALGVGADQTMVLSVGELSARKNHKVVIEALAKLNDPKLVLVICGKAIAGTGTYDSLRQAAEAGNVNVIFAGHRSDIPQICHCADIGVLPSTREGLGLAGIEMMSAGVPLVTSDVHGIRDYMTQGETGYLCDPQDADAFAEAIRKLCDPAVRETLRETCIAAASRFDISVSLAQRQKIYQELLSTEN